MSTSFLYHTNNVQGVHYKSTRYEGGAVIFQGTLKREYVACPKCRCRRAHHSKGRKVRQMRLLPIGSRACFLDLEVHRLKCIKCGHLWWPQASFQAGKRRMSRSFSGYIVELMKLGTVKGVSSLLGISWDTVKDIHKEALKKMYRTIEYSKLRYIGIDEFSLKKGHYYMTTILNLETGQIIHAVEGRDKKAVMPFLRRLARKAHNLKAIAMDMSGPYASAAKEVLPDVEIVFDHFHVTGLINRSIDELRREQQKRCDRVGIKTLKGCRFLLLPHYERLNPRKREGLKKLLEINAPLATAHAMKEQFRVFWLKATLVKGAGFLVTWIWEAMDSGIKQLAATGKTLLHHCEGLLNFFKHRVTNAKTEGINNKIKTLKRQAYGYRDMEYFKLRLFHLHKQGYSLTG